MHVDTPTELDARGLVLGVATSRYHEDITGPLLEGATAAFIAAGGAPDDLVSVAVPGGYELTAVCRALVDRPDIDGVVALGCIIRGETSHDQHLADAIVHGLTRLTIDTGKPVAFGVLTCHTKHQARDRAGGAKGNKGAEAMAATIEAIHAVRAVAETRAGMTAGGGHG